jgi:DamX protein
MKAEREPQITIGDDGDTLLERYEFSHDPFLPRTPGFKFFTPQRKNVLAQLHHLARFSDQTLTVLGPLGAGKSLLRQALVASSNKESVQAVVIFGREVRNAKSLIAFIAQAVGSEAASEEAVLERAEQLYTTGVNLHLVVDDAQLLESAALQALADMGQIGEKFAPRVFLFGDEELARRLESIEAPKEDWLHTIELQPYSLDETRDYLAQRLEAAGQGIELLSDEQVEAIHSASGGWPGRINEQGRRIMLEDIDEEPRPGRPRRAPLPMRSLVALVLVGLGVAAAWMMGDRSPEPARTVLQLPEPVVEVDVSTAPGDRPEAVLVMPGDEDLMEAVSAAPEDVELVQIESPIVASPPPVEAPAPVVPRLPDSTAPAPVQAPAAPTVPSPRAEAPVPAQAAPTPAPTAAATPRPATSTGGAHGADWYRQRPASEYALQLLGTRSRQAAADFVSRHAGVRDMGFFETRHEGQPWFVVTQGAYATRQQAQQGIAALPEALRKQNPWPRSMASIQQSLL